MTNKHLIYLLGFSSLLICTLFSSKAMATVGGPLFVSDIAYNPLTNLIYYVKNDQGGRGCPPIIQGIDTTTRKDNPVKSCDVYFQEYGNKYSDTAFEKYMDYVTDFYKNLANLGSVSLKKNNIDVVVTTVSVYTENDEQYWTEFQAVVTQDTKEVEKINFRGCDKSQPHLFEGYMIPNTKLMALLISTKGDCFETGYITESLHLIDDITYYDTNPVRGSKQASATEPNIGNVTVYAIPNEVTPPEPENQYQQDTSKYATRLLILSGGIIFSSGIILGYILRKRKSNG